MGLNSRYEIRVRGILDARWTAWFEDLQVTSEGQETVIAGPVADQAALHGLLTKVRDLGLFLISVRHLDPDDLHATPTGHPRRKHQEEIMHPVIIRQLATDHIREMHAEAEDERMARQRAGPSIARRPPGQGFRPAMIPA